jgi:starch phosphorylase
MLLRIPDEVPLLLQRVPHPETPADPIRQETTRIRQLVGTVGGYLYRGSVPATRPPTDYTARIIPHHDGVAVPLEAARILWQR